MQLDEDDKKLIANFFLIGIVMSFIFIMIISYISIFDNNNINCGSNRYGENAQGLTSNISFIRLNNTDAYHLQEFNIDNEDNINYRFCYNVITTVSANSTKGLNLNIIDVENNILGYDFTYPDTEYYCSDLTELESGKRYIGLNCVNCNTTQYVDIKKYTYGDDFKQVFYNTDLEVYNDKAAAYRLTTYTNCFNLYRIFTAIYLSVLAVLMLLFGIIVGHKKIRDMALNEE